MKVKLSEIEAWVASALAPPLGEGEFTVRSLAEQNGITESRAIGLVQHGLAAGEIEAVGKRYVGNKKPMAYRVKRKRKG